MADLLWSEVLNIVTREFLTR